MGPVPLQVCPAAAAEGWAPRWTRLARAGRSLREQLSLPRSLCCCACAGVSIAPASLSRRKAALSLQSSCFDRRMPARKPSSACAVVPAARLCQKNPTYVRAVEQQAFLVMLTFALQAKALCTERGGTPSADRAWSQESSPPFQSHATLADPAACLMSARLALAYTQALLKTTSPCTFPIAAPQTCAPPGRASLQYQCRLSAACRCGPAPPMPCRPVTSPRECLPQLAVKHAL